MPFKNREDRRAYDKEYHKIRYYGTNGKDLWEKQKGLCAICAVDLNTLPTKQQTIDHCHATGAVRGLLCQHCNIGLGHFKDSKDLLLKAAEYLDV